MSTKNSNPWESAATPRIPDPSTNGGVAKPAGAGGSSFDVKRILSVWPYMIICGVIAVFMSWTYLRFQINIYETSTRIVIENDTETTLQQALFSNRDPLYDQIALLKSPTVAKRVVDRLKIQYRSVLRGKIKDKELFNELKWSIEKAAPAREGRLSFQIQPNENGFEWSSGGLKGKAYWGEFIDINGNLVRVTNFGSFSKQAIIDCFENDEWTEAENLSANLGVSSSKESNVVKLWLRDNVAERATAILNQLVAEYAEEVKISKSKSLQQSYEFIQQRLAPVAFELDSIELAIAEYKGRAGIVGDKSKGAMYQEKSLDYEEQLKQLDLKKSFLRAAERTIQDPANKPEQFSVSGVEDAELQNSIVAYQQVLAEKQKLGQTVTSRNPRMIDMESKVKEARENIDIKVKSYRNNIALIESNIATNLAQAKAELRTTPLQEKTILEQSRMQNIKMELFLELLKKREDMGRALAGVSVKVSVLSPSKVPRAPISPQPGQVMLAALIAGLALPVFAAIVAELFNKKIVSKGQIQGMSTIPVLAEIDQADKNMEGELVVKDKQRSVIGEQFRILRTNLNFYNHSKRTFYVMTTSSMSGEGKSFLSANLASSFAILGKRTALLEFDLRKPKLSERFKLRKGKGLVNVLMGECHPSEVARPLNDHQVFHLFPTGPIPPNPSELMAMEGMNTLKKYLDENYDVVIIDTPPYSLVADSQMLEPWADVTLVIVRFRKTLKEQIRELQEVSDRGVFRNMAIIFNGIKTTGYYGYNYGYYGVKRKYGYNYYEKGDGTKVKQKLK